MSDHPRHPGLKRWPLSYAQEMLWFLGKRWPDADLPKRLTVTMTDTLTGPLPPDLLRAAIADLLDRHEVLRSAVVVEDGEAAMVVLPSVPVSMRVHDLTDRPAAEREAAAAELLPTLGAGGVSAFDAPPIRFELLTVQEDLHHLTIVAHHLFFDYWSAQVLRTELHKTVDALRAGEPAPLAAAELQYVDFAEWEREVAHSPAMQPGLDYWVEQLADLPPLRLPTDRPRPWSATGAARRATLLLPGELVDGIRELALRHRASPFMVLSGVFLGLLSELTGQDDVAIPTIFAGRIHPDTQQMLGYFDNLLFLRRRRVAGSSVDEMVAASRDTVLAAYEHHAVPMLRIMESQPRLMLLLANAVNIWTLFHLEVDPYRLRAGADGIAGAGDGGDAAPDPGDAAADDEEDVYSFGADLDVTLREESSALYVRVLYSVDLFDAGTVTGMLDRFRVALERAVANPARPVEELYG